MDIGAYKAKMENTAALAEKLSASAAKIDFCTACGECGHPTDSHTSALVMPFVLSVLLVIGALVGLTIWLI